MVGTSLTIPVPLRSPRASSIARTLDVSSLVPTTPVSRRGSLAVGASPRAQRKRGSTHWIEGSERVRTGVRLRPTLPREKAGDSCVVIEEETRVILIDPQLKESRAFECDIAFDSSAPSSGGHADQQAVYDAVGRNLVENATEGYNCCLIAYGQTGTGKTYTMVGDPTNAEHRGLLPRLADGIFEKLARLRSDGAQGQVLVSFLELYNNRLLDLLGSAAPPPDAIAPSAAPEGTPVCACGNVMMADSRFCRKCGAPRPGDRPSRAANGKLDIRSHPAIGVYVENLAELSAKTTEDINKFITMGEKSRHTDSTSMNQRSSRSHAIFSIKVETRRPQADDDAEQDAHNVATVQVVDLAGRENEQTSECVGERFNELIFINRSLFQLATCINALSDGGRKHVPFRDSKLTMLLSESVQRNSRTCLLAALSPAPSAFEENLLTCRFLESTGRVATVPTPNRFSAAELRRQLEAELEAMRQQEEVAFGRVGAMGRRNSLGQTNGLTARGRFLSEEEEAKLRVRMSLGLPPLPNEGTSSPETPSPRPPGLLPPGASQGPSPRAGGPPPLPPPPEHCQQMGKALTSAAEGIARLDAANLAAEEGLDRAESRLVAVEEMVLQTRRELGLYMPTPPTSAPSSEALSASSVRQRRYQRGPDSAREAESRLPALVPPAGATTPRPALPPLAPVQRKAFDIGVSLGPVVISEVALPSVRFKV
eukprot:TRINITY_DN31251_c0_g1_i1.p1 TRINITY_DN31251_c0_g1~~TRINITY_DN31251_c0_g1_i1.p1  ORF type:complete len:710 (+),score=125.10 TRINITY_DN31251_c0_g1_i1:37-2166(+)